MLYHQPNGLKTIGEKMINIDATQHDDTCYIIGGGPSLKGFNWSLLDGKFVIAINCAYDVLPNAQVIYFTDDDWYFEHKEKLAKHSAIKVKGSLDPKKIKDKDLVQYHLTRANGLVLKEGCLAHGQNSAYAAINLASVHWGFKNIYLLGIDMKWGEPGNKKTSHWHSGHTRIDGESIYTLMMRNYATLVNPLRDRGVKVVNINDPKTTKLTSFPIISVEQHFQLAPIES